MTNGNSKRGQGKKTVKKKGAKKAVPGKESKAGDGKHGGGRPPFYDEKKHPAAVREIAAQTMFAGRIASMLGIHLATFYQWLIDHPEFSEAMEQGKASLVGRVERSLIQLATGYKYEDPQAMVSDPADPTGKSKVAKIHVVVADRGAAERVLDHLCPEFKKSKNDPNPRGKGQWIDLSKYDDAECEAIVKREKPARPKR